MRSAPKLSIVVVVHRMARQAARALGCLRSDYQRNVRQGDYEVIVVENDSDDVLGEDAARSFGPQFRYFHRNEKRPTPAFALTFGVAQARSVHVGVLLDGAHLLTPRILEFAWVGRRMASNAVVAIPGYHLGSSHQHAASAEGYDEKAEEKVLSSVDWENDPYRLFEISVSAPGMQSGYLVPMPEAGMAFFSRSVLRDMRENLQRFVDPGGGAIASYLLCEACRAPNAEFFVLAGEGAFHQFHGGVYTSARPDREALLKRRTRRLQQMAAGVYELAEREPRLLGVLTGHAQGHVRASGRALTLRAKLKSERGAPLWPAD